MSPQLYLADEVAGLLNLHVKTIRRSVRDGRLKARRIGKEYRIARADLDDFAGETRPARHPWPGRGMSSHRASSTCYDQPGRVIASQQ
jgi:excisionase family DNA binding protein